MNSSLNVFFVAKKDKPPITTKEIIVSLKGCFATKLPRTEYQFLFVFLLSFFSLAFTGNIAIKAGRAVVENKKAIVIPKAVMFPKSQKGGTSPKFIVKNPMTVVKLVMKTGIKFNRIDSTNASILLRPSFRIFCSIVMSICILSATASVRIIVINVAEGGVNFIPMMPIKPTALIIENSTTTNVAIVL